MISMRKARLEDLIQMKASQKKEKMLLIFLMFEAFIQKVSTFLTFHKTVKLVYNIFITYSHSFPPNEVERTVLLSHSFSQTL